MPNPPAPVELLRLLLGIPEDAPVYATPAFRPWFGPDQEPAWPPRASGGLWLVDTADRAARATEEVWAGSEFDFDAALVVSGSGPPASPLRRLLRRVRGRGLMRWPEQRVAPLLQDHRENVHVQRLAFEDRLELCYTYELAGDDSTGAAFLLTREPPFHGPLWDVIRSHLGDRTTLQTLRLRIRGAAVLTVVAGSRRVIVRVVPDSPLRDVVRRHQRTICDLHDRLEGRPDLLGRVPTPAFDAEHDGVLLLGESYMPGVVAWKAETERLRPVIRSEALAFLDALRSATAVRAEGDAIKRMIARDRERLDKAGFVDDGLRKRVRSVLDRAETTLKAGIPAYTSHGDYGYGNILVNPDTGRLLGVIDWDTSRAVDLPGIDRVNLELQRGRNIGGQSFAEAVRSVWRERRGHQTLLQDRSGETGARALYGVAVCRYVARSFAYPEVFKREEESFRAGVGALADL